MKHTGWLNWRTRIMNDLKIVKLSEKMYVNLHAISHLEIVNDSSNGVEKYAILYLLRTQNGDRIYLSKPQADILLKVLAGFEI